MKSIYALAINGNMFYFSGPIYPNIYKNIDSLIKRIDIDPQDKDYKIFCEKFILLIKSELNIELKQLVIKYVFRK